MPRPSAISRSNRKSATLFNREPGRYIESTPAAQATRGHEVPISEEKGAGNLAEGSSMEGSHLEALKMKPVDKKAIPEATKEGSGGFLTPIGTSLDGKVVLHSRRNSLKMNVDREGSGVEDALPDLEANLETPRSLSDATEAITGTETDNGVRTEKSFATVAEYFLSQQYGSKVRQVTVCVAVQVALFLFFFGRLIVRLIVSPLILHSSFRNFEKQVTSMLVKPIDIVLVLVLSLYTLWYIPRCVSNLFCPISRLIFFLLLLIPTGHSTLLKIRMSKLRPVCHTHRCFITAMTIRP